MTRTFTKYLIDLKELEQREQRGLSCYMDTPATFSATSERCLCLREECCDCCGGWQCLYLPSIWFPSVVVRLVCEPPEVVPGLQLPHVTPALVVLQPGVQQGLVHGVSLTELDLHSEGTVRVSDMRTATCSRLVISSMASLCISFQGWGGYMKAAFCICSLMSSSSLKGKVPERET